LEIVVQSRRHVPRLALKAKALKAAAKAVRKLAEGINVERASGYSFSFH
jgi:hypothetical protein